jgi:hypothetical protein
VPRCSNPSACMATQNAVRPASLLLLCLGATDRGRTETLGAVRELGRTAEVSVMNVTGRVAVGNGSGVQRSVVTAGTPTVVLLGHDMYRRGPGTLGAASCAVQQHCVELGFGNSEPVRCQSTWSAGDWWAR